MVCLDMGKKAKKVGVGVDLMLCIKTESRSKIIASAISRMKYQSTSFQMSSPIRESRDL